MKDFTGINVNPEHIYLFINDDQYDGYTVRRTETDGFPRWELEVPSFKERTNNYKELLDELDDDIFVESVEELTSYGVDLKKLDELLDKEELSDLEETYVEYLAGFLNSIIREHIDDKINKLRLLK
jgi:hypothetical protein